MLDVATIYFDDLFSSQGQDDSHRILEGVASCIIDYMNVALLAQFTMADILSTLKSMAPMKASRLDGLPALFYQKFWHIVGPFVSDYCLGVLNEGMLIAVNRFQLVLHLCVDKVQSSFVPERLITNNIILAYQIFDVFRRKQWSRKGHFALKLDISKDYDRVEWVFLEQMMLRIRFSDRWVSLFLHCVRSVSYSVTMNGEVSRPFSPGRGH
ncbi:uncharacterized protein LOC105801029 [Gossypium raimondii]|uniref:uncharacterized protein LOC105801029 n=1 Tax=Gossypium raimondii TaxID=29730 RepID=UPI00063A8CF0|nr:uncharacterized protein LOC105801029 [Gossypium raimondii]